MMRPTVYAARWVFPVSSPAIRDGAVLVDANGRIERVAAACDFPIPEDALRIDFGNAAILPGLVNVHAHPELAMFRGVLDDLPFHSWIPTLMRLKRAAQLTAEDFDVAARWTCVESLRAGITTVGATEDSGAAVAAINEAGMRGLVFLEVFGPAPEQAADSMAALREKVEHFRTNAGTRVAIGVSPHAPFSVSDELFKMVAEYALSENLPLATHTAESEAEELLVCAGAGPFAAGHRKRGIATPVRARSTVDLLARTGILGTRPLLIHAVRMSEDDVCMVADAGASIAHCPVANARLGHGTAPIVEAAAAGIVVGLGTDSVASNNRLDLLEEARIAQTLQRARLRNAEALPGDQLLRMATIDGATILGLANRIGSLESGKDADLCVVSFAGAHCTPATDPLSTLFHAARGSDVAMTMVGGVPLFADGRVTSLDENDLRARVSAIGERLMIARCSL